METSISFSKADFELFARASGDRNPLHCSLEYARQTPYGQPVVFGCLGAIACLGALELPSNTQVVAVESDFLRPMFAAVNYRFELTSKNQEKSVRLLDGSIPVLSLKVTFGPKLESINAERAAHSSFEHDEAIDRAAHAITPGLSVAGRYAPDLDSLQELCGRWGDTDPYLVSLLCFSSYLIGMEMPGERALFSKVILNLAGLFPSPCLMNYEATVTNADSRFSQIRVEASLSTASRQVASLKFVSFVRPELPEEEHAAGTPDPNILAGKVAVVVGASRGLGAAITRALESRGAEVYTIARSSCSAPSHVMIGDAADLATVTGLRDEVLSKHGRLDFLICNACPPIPSLRLEPNAVQRIEKYITEAVSLTLTPLCAFLDLLNATSGCAVVISSQAVEQPVRDWPHYVAAKQAIEMLGQVAVMQYPRIHVTAVRPPKLLTAMTNSPVSRSGASPAEFANRLLTHLEQPLTSGDFEYFG